MSAGTAHDLIQLITQTQIPEPEQPDSNLTSGQLSQMLIKGFGFEASLEIDGQYLTRAQTADCIWQTMVDQYIDRMNLVTEVQDPAAIYELVYYAHMIPRSVWLDFDRNGYQVVYDDDRLNEFTVSFVKGLYSLGKKTVYVRVGYPFVLLHEMGHHVYYDYDINWILGTIFENERANAVSIMRPYAGNNKADFFCRLLYVLHIQSAEPGRHTGACGVLPGNVSDSARPADMTRVSSSGPPHPSRISPVNSPKQHHSGMNRKCKNYIKTGAGYPAPVYAFRRRINKRRYVSLPFM